MSAIVWRLFRGLIGLTAMLLPALVSGTLHAQEEACVAEDKLSDAVALMRLGKSVDLVQPLLNAANACPDASESFDLAFLTAYTMLRAGDVESARQYSAGARLSPGLTERQSEVALRLDEILQTRFVQVTVALDKAAGCDGIHLTSWDEETLPTAELAAGLLDDRYRRYMGSPFEEVVKRTQRKLEGTLTDQAVVFLPAGTYTFNGQKTLKLTEKSGRVDFNYAPGCTAARTTLISPSVMGIVPISDSLRVGELARYGVHAGYWQRVGTSRFLLGGSASLWTGALKPQEAGDSETLCSESTSAKGCARALVSESSLDMRAYAINAAGGAALPLGSFLTLVVAGTLGYSDLQGLVYWDTSGDGPVAAQNAYWQGVSLGVELQTLVTLHKQKHWSGDLMAGLTGAGGYGLLPSGVDEQDRDTTEVQPLSRQSLLVTVGMNVGIAAHF